MELNKAEYDKALRMMLKAHSGQFMKSDDKLPYAYHCIKVRDKALELAQDYDIDKDYISTVAFLHDTLEDTKVTFDDISKEFGEKVAEGVKTLSKNFIPKCDNYFDTYLDNIVNFGFETVLIKTADRIVNISDIVDTWSLDKHNEYLQESYKIYEKFAPTDEILADKLLAQIKQYESMINKHFNLNVKEKENI